jgi:hypothetical protein
MPKRIALSLALLLLLLLVAGCASPQPGTLITHKAACNVENNDKRVALEGYPRLSGMTYVDDDFSVDLYEQPGGVGDAISVYLTIGTGANQAEDLPDDYSDADLKIHTKDNQVVSTDTRIRVHGTLAVTDTGDSIVCFISPVDLIELAPA